MQKYSIQKKNCSSCAEVDIKFRKYIIFYNKKNGHYLFLREADVLFIVLELTLLKMFTTL